MTPLCDAEIMAIVTIGALLMYPALVGYVELVLLVKLTIKKKRYEQNKKAQTHRC